MPANIGYTILECSGEDAENPCTELLAHTQDSKGWTTPRNGTFPQHLTLQLDQPSRLQQIQLLSHEYKIAGKIELQVASTAGSNDKAHDFTRLGFISFDSNDRTNYSARELKSVTLPDVEATAVKLIIHRCHANTMNTNSQACLIMLNLVGEPLQQAPSSVVPATATTTSIAPGVILSAPPAPFTNPSISIKPSVTTTTSSDEENVDEVTAQRISELQEKKAAAVATEDYDEAKKLKAAIEKLRAVGAKMAALEARKKAAVDVEDYDTAKALKIELERMRHRAYAAIAKGEHHHLHDDNPTVTAHGDRMERLLSPVQQQVAQPTDLNNNNNTIGTTTTAVNPNNVPFSPSLSSMDSYGSSANRSPEINASPFMQKPTTSGGSSDWRSYDERPARATGAYNLKNLEEFNADSAPPGAKITSPNTNGGPLRRIDENAKQTGQTTEGVGEAVAVVVVDNCPPAPPGFPTELPLPEQLSQDDAKESGPMEAVVGPFLTRCLYSKSWQLKEAGITAIATAVGTSSPDDLPRLDGDGDALRLLCGVVAQGLKARIPAIAAAALVLLRSLVRSAAARRFPARDLHAALTELLPVVAERAGDPQVRTREQAVEALVDIARVKESGLKSMTGIFLKSYKITESPKITQGRLYLLSSLLPVLGVVPNNGLINSNAAGGDVAASPGGGGGTSSSGGFSAEAVVQFCCPALKSANAEVRSAAAELVVKVGRAPGVGAQVVLPLVPFDVNPKLKQQLEEDLTGEKRIRAVRSGSINNPKGNSAAAISTAAVPNSSESAPSSKRTSTVAPTSSGNAAVVRPQASSRHHTSSTTTRANAAAAATKPATTKSNRPSQQQQQQQQHQDDYDESNYSQERRPSQHTAVSATSMPPSPPPPQQQHHPANHMVVSTDNVNYHQNYQNQQQSLYPQPPLQEDISTLYTPSVVGPEFSVADEDPAPFEEELRRREATLGPSHPSVAEAASNLAIIYNQRGDGARALPLYQRALNIWEMTHGPHHPDVAHALTDIAVILLEAGHDAQGKQLLRRALGIQMEFLGPMHPDVVAIKDVLDE